ncbi:fatty acyl-CoA synthetase [Nocardia terpenica]|uniref:AMP-binding protein n=1 Tax=Nocardia terpenica TaxID=455432 RepID=A0A6G9ZFR3_9NOCA|nr:fatty acyl-CoA synthetase [Nocardia terpenica]QIS24475.1 AMP-binding protein [Nocardia terpenica]
MTLEPHLSTLDNLLRRSARRDPDRIAVHFADRRWTYRELDDAVSRASAWLAALDLKPGDRVAAYGRNSDAYLIGFLACARAGLIHVPVNYALTGDELIHLLVDSGSTAVLVDPRLLSEVRAIEDSIPGVEVVSLRDTASSLLAAAAAGPVPKSTPVVPDDELVQLLYTSGTTSKPKAAMMTHRALLHEYLSCLVALDFTEHDNPLICMPLYHSAGMHVFAMPYLAVGATVLLLESPDITEVLRRVEADRIGSLFLAPTVWTTLSTHPDLHHRDLSSLRKAQYGASAMPEPVLSRLREQLPGTGFYNCFGQSEIGPLATVLRPEDHDDRPSSCGRSVLFVEVRVVDTDGRDVPAGVPGEAVYRSPQLCTGYWKNATATADAFDGGWFHSGDLVTQDPQGYLTVVDRIKDVINTGGVLVSSREVEDAVYHHESVAEVAVVGLPDPKWIEAVTAFVVLEPAAEVSETELLDHTRQHLAPYKVPKRIVFVEELPRNQSGKVLKRELRRGT